LDNEYDNTYKRNNGQNEIPQKELGWIKTWNDMHYIFNENVSSLGKLVCRHPRTRQSIKKIRKLIKSGKQLE
jgi:hypothetical protein